MIQRIITVCSSRLTFVQGLTAWISDFQLSRLRCSTSVGFRFGSHDTQCTVFFPATSNQAEQCPIRAMMDLRLVPTIPILFSSEWLHALTCHSTDLCAFSVALKGAQLLHLTFVKPTLAKKPHQCWDLRFLVSSEDHVFESPLLHGESKTLTRALETTHQIQLSL